MGLTAGSTPVPFQYLIGDTMIYKLKRFFSNLWWYKSILWNDYEGDWEPTLRILQRKLVRGNRRGLRFSFEDEEYRRETATCIALIDRICEDDYISYVQGSGFAFDVKYGQSQTHCTNKFTHCEQMQQQDMDLLFKILNRKLRTWWD
jgi:hypothetical protein